MSVSLSHVFFCSCSGLLSAPPCLHLTPPDPKLCPIPMTPNGHLDPNLPLGGHLGLAGAAAPAPRLSLQPDPMLVALGSRKSSVMSLGRASYDQRSLVSPCGVLWVATSCWVCAEGFWEVPASSASDGYPGLGHQTVQPEPGRGDVYYISEFPVSEQDRTTKNDE